MSKKMYISNKSISLKKDGGQDPNECMKYKSQSIEKTADAYIYAYQIKCMIEYIFLLP